MIMHGSGACVCPFISAESFFLSDTEKRITNMEKARRVIAGPFLEREKFGLKNVCFVWNSIQVMFEGVLGSVWGLPSVSYEMHQPLG